MSDIEIGKTYEYVGHPRGMEGRKALVLGRVRNDLFLIRWPDGLERDLHASHMRGPVEPARPGIDEPCLRCGGSGIVEVREPDPDRPWFQRLVAKRPCPSCS